MEAAIADEPYSAELTGNGTPVTEESFAKWKAERKSKKEAEEEAKQQKEATGRAMFEKGDWRMEDSEEESDEEGGDAFDLAALRKETRALEGDEDDDDENIKVYGTT